MRGVAKGRVDETGTYLLVERGHFLFECCVVDASGLCALLFDGLVMEVIVTQAFGGGGRKG